jgi:hypothetical protein
MDHQKGTNRIKILASLGVWLGCKNPRLTRKKLPKLGPYKIRALRNLFPLDFEERTSDW